MFVLASNHFRKCFSLNASISLCMENKFSENYFQLTGCFEVKIFTSNHFQTHVQRHREREPSTLTSPTSPITAFNFDFADLRTHRSRLRLRWSTNQSTNPWTDLRPTNLRLRRQPKAFAPRTDLRPRAFDLEPRTDLSLSLWFWFSVWFWSTHKPTSLWSLIFLLLFWWCGWWCFGGFPVVWWWVLCGWWWKIAFS